MPTCYLAPKTIQWRCGWSSSYYSRDPRKVAEILGISEDYLSQILLKLEGWELLHRSKGVVKTNLPNVHLGEDAPVLLTYRIVSRLKAIEKITKNGVQSSAQEDYSVSVLFSADKKFQQQFRRQLIDLIKSAHSHVGRATSEEVFQLNIDFLKWSQLSTDSN